MISPVRQEAQGRGLQDKAEPALGGGGLLVFEGQGLSSVPTHGGTMKSPSPCFKGTRQGPVDETGCPPQTGEWGRQCAAYPSLGD